jgi:hypothetical protein
MGFKGGVVTCAELMLLPERGWSWVVYLRELTERDIDPYWERPSRNSECKFDLDDL